MIHDQIGVKLLMRFQLKFSHLNEQNFRHTFKDTVVAMCICGTETEITEHLFLRCPFFVTERQKHLKNVYDKLFPSQNLSKESMIDILLYECDNPHKKISKILALHSGIIVVLSNK